MADTQPWTITSSPAMQAVEAKAEREHLASTADADRKLIGDDQGPHWLAVEHAEEVLSRVDATALCTLRDLDRQCDARGREISRLRAELAQHRDQVLTEAATELERIADEAEAKVAAHYGHASGIGPGSADMVREAARTVRSLAARTTQ